MTRRRCKRGATVEERLALHTVVAPSGCWVWAGAIDDKGYGRFLLDGKTRYAHRVTYETLVGPIPEGMQLDHLCRYPRCVKPLHLQPVTARENMLRGTSPGARARRRDRCLKGHAYADFSVVHGGRTYCRGCMKANHARYNAAKSAERVQRRADLMADLVAYRDRDREVSA